MLLARWRCTAEIRSLRLSVVLLTADILNYCTCVVYWATTESSAFSFSFLFLYFCIVDCWVSECEHFEPVRRLLGYDVPSCRFHGTLRYALTHAIAWWIPFGHILSFFWCSLGATPLLLVVRAEEHQFFPRRLRRQIILRSLLLLLLLL